MTHDDGISTTRPPEAILNEITRLRLEGDLKAAFGLINERLKMNPRDALFILEAVHQALLMQEKELALKLYKRYSMVQQTDGCDRPEVLLRLHLSATESVPALDNVVLESGPLWCQAYARDGIDPLYAANLHDLAVTCQDGTSSYTLTCQCPSCQQSCLVFVYMSFLIYRKYLCPTCLAQLFVDYESIKAWVQSKLSPQVKQRLNRFDDHLTDLKKELNFDMISENKYPQLCQYLNQDYIFILSQLVLKRL